MEADLRLIALILILTLGVASQNFGQSGRNPFELIPRLERKAATQALDELNQTRGTGNPFDLMAASVSSDENTISPVAPKAQPLPRETAFQRFFFITAISLLLFFASLISLFRSYFVRAFQAFLNDNMLNQAQRDIESGRAMPFFLFYFFFLLNASAFILVLAQYLGVSLTPKPALDGLIYFGVVVAGFFLKHLLLWTLGWIFPVEKEASTYSFMIVVFGIILGGALLPANLLLVYSPENMMPYLSYGALIVIGLIYLFRTLRALFMAGQYLAFHTFHFLLYICTVEIAPVLILIKLVTRQL